MAALMMVASLINVTGTDAYPRTNVLWFEVGPAIRNCQDVQKQGNQSSGVYTIFPYNCCPELPVKVFCDMETDGDGWTVIQRRDDLEPREDFFRTWMEYALGFGNLKGEFWLGLDHIHALTDQRLNQLRFDLADFDNNTRWGEYKFFYVHDRSLNYKMEVNEYTGDAGDGFSVLHGQSFTTKDKDLDTHSDNCATMFKGAWWYASCHSSNLNGFYYAGSHTTYADGVNWSPWHGQHYSLKKTEIKIRPAL